jgi:O-antigen/teichoic acid export membrane protein
MRNARRNLLASYLGNGWAALVGVAVLPMYLRYLGIEAIGLVGFLGTLQAWLLMLDLGLAPTLNREMARFSAGEQTAKSIGEVLRTLELVALMVAVSVFIAMAALSAWIASEWLQLGALPVEAVSTALIIMGAGIAAQWLSALYRAALFGLQHHVWVSTLAASLATTRAVSTLAVLAFVSPTVTAFVVAQAGISFVETWLLARRVRGSVPRGADPPRFSWTTLKALWRFAAGLALTGLFGTLLTQFDKIILARVLPLEQYGYFTLAMTIAGAFALIIVPIFNIAYPRFSNLVAKKDAGALAEDYHKFSVLLSVVVISSVLVVATFSREIIYLWTNDNTLSENISPVLTVWLIGTGLNGLMHIPYAAQLAHGWSRLAMGANAIAAAIMIPAILYWVPKYGPIAAAWIWVGVNFLFLLAVIPVMHLRILRHQEKRWYINAVVNPAFSGLTAVLLIQVAGTGFYPENRLIQIFYLLLVMLLLAAVMLTSTQIGREFLRTTFHGNWFSRELP